MHRKSSVDNYTFLFKLSRSLSKTIKLRFLVSASFIRFHTTMPVLFKYRKLTFRNRLRNLRRHVDERERLAFKISPFRSPHSLLHNLDTFYLQERKLASLGPTKIFNFCITSEASPPPPPRPHS